MRITEVRFTRDAVKELDSLGVRATITYARVTDAMISGIGPAVIDEYEPGLYRARHMKSAYDTRGLFTMFDTCAIFVLLYKKESNAVPQRHLNTARARIARLREEGPI